LSTKWIKSSEDVRGTGVRPYTVFLGLAAGLVALTVWSVRYQIT
jgi:hypothetical protein